MSLQSSDQTNSHMGDDLTARKHRINLVSSDLYDESESEVQRTDGNPLDEDGLSDSELEEDLDVRRSRRRFSTFDAYERDEAFPPVGTEQIVPTLSAQAHAGVVKYVGTTPSNPVMLICRAVPSHYGTLHVPFQYFTPVASMTSMPVANMISATSTNPPSVGGNDSSNGDVASASTASPPTSPPTPPPGNFGRKPPPGCWGGADAAARLLEKPMASATQTNTQRMKRNLKQNAKQPESTRTTIMLRNLPSYFTRDMVLALLDSLGLAHKYDFVHMPSDLVRLSCLGFAFVNFRIHEDALQFFEAGHEFKNWQRSSNKVLSLSWSTPLQGLAAQIHRYRNATIMHPSVPEQCKPLIFGNDGERIPFPAPTVELRVPRCS